MSLPLSSLSTDLRVLHDRAVAAANGFKRAETELLRVLQEVDEERLYLHLKCSSLYGYATTVLRLSEAVASNFITVARKAKEVPGLMDAIARGELEVSKARKICPVLEPESFSPSPKSGASTPDSPAETAALSNPTWIERAVTFSTRELERAVASQFPERPVREQIRPVAEARHSVRLGISDDLLAKLQRARDHVSRSKRKSASLEETLDELLEFYLEKNDPVEKAKRVLAKKPKPQEQKNTQTCVTGQKPVRYEREPIPAAELHKVRARDLGQCTQIDPSTAKRCPERRWVQVHHIQLVSEGGANTAENLTTLCSGHHRAVHLRDH